MKVSDEQFASEGLWIVTPHIVYGTESVDCGLYVSADEYSCVHGAQINFGDPAPYLTYELRVSKIAIHAVSWSRVLHTCLVICILCNIRAFYSLAQLLVQNVPPYLYLPLKCRNNTEVLAMTPTHEGHFPAWTVYGVHPFTPHPSLTRKSWRVYACFKSEVRGVGWGWRSSHAVRQFMQSAWIFTIHFLKALCCSTEEVYEYIFSLPSTL